MKNQNSNADRGVGICTKAAQACTDSVIFHKEPERSPSNNCLEIQNNGSISDRPIDKEMKPLLLGLALLAGTVSFCMVMQALGKSLPQNWLWGALAIAIICLPTAFEKLRKRPEPYIILLARAFRIGFWSLLVIVESLIGSKHIPWARSRSSLSSLTQKIDLDST